MSPDFLPLRPSPPAATDSGPASLRILRAPQAQPAFTPFAKPQLHSCHASSQNGTPKVSLLRDGERVTGIRIQCSCGQILELACEF